MPITYKHTQIRIYIPYANREIKCNKHTNKYTTVNI